MRTFPALIVLVALSMWTCSVHAQNTPTQPTPSDSRSRVALDPRTGCRFIPFGDPAITTKGTPQWDGPCVSGQAHGRGKLQWVVDGKPVVRYEGEFRQGVIQGRYRGVEHLVFGEYEGELIPAAEAEGMASIPDGRCTLMVKPAGRYDGVRRAMANGCLVIALRKAV